MNLMMDGIACETDPEVEEEVVPIETYIPSKILSKRKFKGIPHYLVQWVGYPKVEDRTWEPCERLSVDVPLLVEGFEEKKGRKKGK